MNGQKVVNYLCSVWSKVFEPPAIPVACELRNRTSEGKLAMFTAYLVDDAEGRSDRIIFVHENNAHEPIAVVCMTEELILAREPMERVSPTCA